MTPFRWCVALLAVALVATAAPVPKLQRAEPFPYAVGTTWEYVHDGDKDQVWVERVGEVTEKDGAVTFKVDITTASGQKRFETYRLKDKVLVIIESDSGTFDPPMLIAKAGMKPGDEWENQWTLHADGFKSVGNTTLTVGKPEVVTTPAGKFTALPVTRSQGRGVPSTTFWFADGVGMIRQTTDGQKAPDQDLKAFTRGKGK